MKSDSGGEMESCRSSDSELERELHEKEKEILERDRELTNCYRTLAERDTDLIKVRLECQRLLEDNRQLRSQINNFSEKGGVTSKRQIEMERVKLLWTAAFYLRPQFYTQLWHDK